jgi:hypothetical protein
MLRAMASQLAISDAGGLVDAMTGEPVSLAGLIAVGSAYTQTDDTTTRTVPAEVTNSTGGTAQAALAAGMGVYQIAIPVNLATVADGDVLTTLPIPHKFKILSVDAYVTQEVTTADKTTALNVEIGTTNLTGGVVTVTSAAAATLGAKIAGTAVTAANTGAAAATISIEAASTTAHAEGQVMVVIAIQNMDDADGITALLAEIATNRQLINAIIDDLQEAQAEA